MSQKDSKKGVRGLFRHFFDTPGREARKRLFETFWGFRGSEVWRLLYMGIAIVNLGEKLKGSLLKGSFDKARALTCRFLCRSLPHPPPSPPPSPFPFFSTGEPPSTTHLNPTPNPSSRDTRRNLHPVARTTPGKNYWLSMKPLREGQDLHLRNKVSFFVRVQLAVPISSKLC